MDAMLAMGLVVIGFLMLVGGFGGKIVIGLPFIEFAGMAGVFVMLIGIAGLIGVI